MTRIYILIVNWNGWQDTIECLESVFRLEYSDYRVIICDNGSTDESCEKIVAWADGRLPAMQNRQNLLFEEQADPALSKPISHIVYDREEAERGGNLLLDSDLILIRIGKNLGFAGGNNVGLRYALARDDFSHVWLLNNDTVVVPHALPALVQRMRERPSAGLCGSTLLSYNSPDRIQARGGGWYCKWIGLPWHIGQLDSPGANIDPDKVERWMSYVVGASMLVSKEFLQDIGLMCEDYFLYFEELDWALRGKDRFDLAYAPDSIVYHKIGRSIGTSSDPRYKSKLCDFYAIRNRLLFTKRFFPAVLPFIYASVFIAFLVRVAVGQWERAWVVWRVLLNHQSKISE